MKSTDSITADEKRLLEYAYEKASDIADYLHRNGMKVPVSILVEPDYKGIDGTVYDYKSVTISEDYESGNIKRIITHYHNYHTGKTEYHCTNYEDEKNDE